MVCMKVRTQDSYRVPLSENLLENPGIDPGTSHMLSERSTIWANPPDNVVRTLNQSHLEPRGQAHMDGQLKCLLVLLFQIEFWRDMLVRYG